MVWFMGFFSVSKIEREEEKKWRHYINFNENYTSQQIKSRAN